MLDLLENKAKLQSLSKPKAVIFDWDNTLVDTWPLIQMAIDKTMVAMGKEPWGLEKVRDNVHKSMRESFPAIFGDDWVKAGDIYRNAYREIHLQEINFLSNSLNLINKLSEMNILQCVVSNKMGVTLRKEAAKIDADKHFFSLIGAMDASFDKPSRDPVDLALLGSDINPDKDEVWFIGDTVSDVNCAYNSGCTPIVYGCVEGELSKTISDEFAAKGKDGSGALPVYFNHQDLIEVLCGY